MIRIGDVEYYIKCLDWKTSTIRDGYIDGTFHCEHNLILGSCAIITDQWDVKHSVIINDILPDSQGRNSVRLSNVYSCRKVIRSDGAQEEYNLIKLLLANEDWVMPGQKENRREAIRELFELVLLANRNK